MDMHCNRWLAGHRRPPKCRLSLGSTGSPRAARQARRRPRKHARGTKRPAPNSPGPADSAALQTLATRPHDAVDNAKRPGWDPTALHVLSSPHRTDHRALYRGGYFDSAPEHDPEPEEAGDTELLCSPSGGGSPGRRPERGGGPQGHIAGAAVPVISLLRPL